MAVHSKKKTTIGFVKISYKQLWNAILTTMEYNEIQKWNVTHWFRNLFEIFFLTSKPNTKVFELTDGRSKPAIYLRIIERTSEPRFVFRTKHLKLLFLVNFVLKIRAKMSFFHKTYFGLPFKPNKSKKGNACFNFFQILYFEAIFGSLKG